MPAHRLTSARIRGCIRLDACDHNPLCHGYRWTILDEAALAQLVSWTMQGRYFHAEHVLRSLGQPLTGGNHRAKAQAISRLRLPRRTADDDPLRWHRDGLLFQHISWIAAQIDGDGRVASSPPHIRPAEKGFDAILIPLNNRNEALEGLMVCEDKATGNPRSTFRDLVLPEIKAIEDGDREAELTHELATILRAYNVRNTDAVLENARWLNRKTYRVSMTISTAHDSTVLRHRLFQGFETTARGSSRKRRAETLALDDLRDWMNRFALRTIRAIKKMTPDV